MVLDVDEKDDLGNVVLFRDLTEGQASGIFDALAAADPTFVYRLVPSLVGIDAGRSSPAAVVFWASVDQADILFRDIDACSKLSRAPVAVITDHDDLAFMAKCYDRGVKGVLTASMLASNVAMALNLIASGGTFFSSRMITTESKS